MCRNGSTATGRSGSSGSTASRTICRISKPRSSDMAVKSAANSDTFALTTPSDREVRMTRLFDAPRRLVFEAMTKPEHITQWWGRLGDGYSVPVCEADVRPGGRYHYVNRHPNGQAEFYGVYREVVPPDRLVF